MEHSVPFEGDGNVSSPCQEYSLFSLGIDVVNYASYLQNRVPHKLVVGATPFEALHGHKPNVSNLRVFGSKAWTQYPLIRERPSKTRVANAYY